MKLRSIETTPNPNCMMLKVDENFGDRSVTIEATEVALDPAAVGEEHRVRLQYPDFLDG